jgi:hypothetical protein
VGIEPEGGGVGVRPESNRHALTPRCRIPEYFCSHATSYTFSYTVWLRPGSLLACLWLAEQAGVALSLGKLTSSGRVGPAELFPVQPLRLF